MAKSHVNLGMVKKEIVKAYVSTKSEAESKMKGYANKKKKIFFMKRSQLDIQRKKKAKAKKKRNS